MGFQDFGTINYNCIYCQKRMISKKVFFSNCEGKYVAKFGRKKHEEELKLADHEMAVRELKDAMAAWMDLKKYTAD